MLLSTVQLCALVSSVVLFSLARAELLQLVLGAILHGRKMFMEGTAMNCQQCCVPV